MSMRNKDVVSRFIDMYPARTLNLSSDGEKLFSYYTCIAQFHEGKLIGNATKYSKSTSTHFNMVFPYVTVVTTKPVPRGATSLVEYL